MEGGVGDVAGDGGAKGTEGVGAGGEDGGGGRLEDGRGVREVGFGVRIGSRGEVEFKHFEGVGGSS